MSSGTDLMITLYESNPCFRLDCDVRALFLATFWGLVVQDSHFRPDMDEDSIPEVAARLDASFGRGHRAGRRGLLSSGRGGVRTGI